MKLALLLTVALSVSCKSPAEKTCALDPDIELQTCATLLDMQLPNGFPADPTNAYADNPDAATFGYLLFFGKDLSNQSPMGCATCHTPEDDFTERTPTAVAIGTDSRNAPTAMNAAWMTTFSWDGHIDVLWAQPIGAFENPIELNSTRLELAHTIAHAYLDRYQTVFGAMPSLDDTTRFPLAGKPGDPAFDNMAPADQEVVNRIAANVGKAIAAYLHKIAAQKSAFDTYLAGDHTAITTNQELGMLLFVQDGCASCHNGPQLSDQKFHNAGVPPLSGAAPDNGRADGIIAEQNAQFSAESHFSDAPQPAKSLAPSASDLGAFRTPSLRNVALTEPYMHNGSFATLDAAIQFHLSGVNGGVGTLDPSLAAQSVDAADRAAIVDFLTTLNGQYPPPPWNFWPNGP